MAENAGFTPKILVFSTNNISDPGVDLAGSSHLHYSPKVVVISLPCTSGIKPDWVFYAVRQGFDGVFIAADGEECAYLPDCSERTAKIMADAQALLQQGGYEPKRVKMAAICSVAPSRLPTTCTNSRRCWPTWDRPEDHPLCHRRLRSTRCPTGRPHPPHCPPQWQGSKAPEI